MYPISSFGTPHLSACRCGYAANQWKAILNSLVESLEKERDYCNSREKSSRDLTEKTNGLNEVQKFIKKSNFLVRLYCFIKISCIRFLWLGPSVRFASTWHLLLTVSWRTLVFSVLGNVTNSLFLCGAMRDVNEICKSRFTTLFIFIRFTA